MEKVNSNTMEEFAKEIDSNFKQFPDKIIKTQDLSGDFQQMDISDIGFGANDYKSSDPNILKNDAVVQEIAKISAAAETAIAHTIGPYADNTLIQTYYTREVPVYNTRDGYTILQNMKFTQPIPNAIFKILRQTAEYMNERIGDSTSSGIPIQHALYTKLVEIFKTSNEGGWKFSPVGIRNICKICGDVIISRIRNNPIYQKSFKKVDSVDELSDEEKVEIIKWLTKIATISANNDYKTGEKIAKLYENKLDGRGDVIVLRSDTEEEYVKESNAYILSMGLLDLEAMANTPDKTSWEAEKPLIAMFDGNLYESDLPVFKQIVQTVAFDLKRPLFVIAPQYDKDIADYLRKCISGTYYNTLGQELNDPSSDPDSRPMRIDIACMVLRNKEYADVAEFDDLRMMVRANPFQTMYTKLSPFSEDREVRCKQIENMFGTCEHISAGYADVNFIGTNPVKEEFDTKIELLNKKIVALKKATNHFNDWTVKELNFRIEKLQSRTTYYYCGGRTDNAKYARKLIIDDAVQAVSAAIKNGGVSIGSNISICHYIRHNFETLVEEIIQKIVDAKLNITAAENYDNVQLISRLILESIEFSFGNGYRYALFNMYRDSKKTMYKWNECIDKEVPSVYNIMTNLIEEFDGNDPDNCTTLIVPKETDECLIKIIIETVGDLLTVGNMITLLSPNMDLEALQLRQLETGAAYMAQNSISTM